MILVYVLMAWHAVAGGELGRSLEIFPTRARCEVILRHTIPARGERLTCLPLHLPPSSLGKRA